MNPRSVQKRTLYLKYDNEEKTNPTKINNLPIQSNLYTPVLRMQQQ